MSYFCDQCDEADIARLSNFCPTCSSTGLTPNSWCCDLDTSSFAALLWTTLWKRIPIPSGLWMAETEDRLRSSLLPVLRSVTPLEYFRRAGGFDICEDDIPLVDFLTCCYTTSNPPCDDAGCADAGCAEFAMTTGRIRCAGSLWTLAVRQLVEMGVTVRNILFFGTGFSDLTQDMRDSRALIQVRMSSDDLHTLPTAATCMKQFNCPWESAIAPLTQDFEANRGLFELIVAQFYTALTQYDRKFMGRV